MNILFIAPFFYGYEKIIKKSLSARYNKVIFRSEVPFNSGVLFYALRRLSKQLADKALDRYAEQLLSLVNRSKINKIFIIRGYGVRAELLAKVRDRFPKVEIINYQWDSLFNNPNGLELSYYAHRNYSFDLADIAQYPHFAHIPLFYTWKSLGEKLTAPDSVHKDIDVLFIGGYHSKRHEITGKVRQECERQGCKMFCHIYFPFWSYMRDQLMAKMVKRKDVDFKKIPRRKYYELLCRSRVVLDIQSTTQKGATMRTFEALSVGDKLISTNEMLLNEKVYSPANIMIWNPDTPLNFDELLNREFDHSKDVDILDLDQWLQEIGI